MTSSTLTFFLSSSLSVESRRLVGDTLLGSVLIGSELLAEELPDADRDEDIDEDSDCIGPC